MFFRLSARAVKVPVKFGIRRLVYAKRWLVPRVSVMPTSCWLATLTASKLGRLVVNISGLFLWYFDGTLHMGDKTVDEPQSLVRRELEFSSVQLTCRETATEESSLSRRRCELSRQQLPSHRSRSMTSRHAKCKHLCAKPRRWVWVFTFDHFCLAFYDSCCRQSRSLTQFTSPDTTKLDSVFASAMEVWTGHTATQAYD